MHGANRDDRGQQRMVHDHRAASLLVERHHVASQSTVPVTCEPLLYESRKRTPTSEPMSTIPPKNAYVMNSNGNRL